MNDNKENAYDELLLENQKLQQETKRLSLCLKETQTRTRTTISAVSHELRNILTLLLGSAHFLEDTYPELPQDENWKCLRSDFAHMQSFLEDLSDYKSLQELSLSYELCDLNGFLKNICQNCLPLFDGTHKRLILSCPKLPITVYADAKKLSHVFTNLIKNGLEALDAEGTVSLCLRNAHDYEDHLVGAKSAAIEIKDSGSGISEPSLRKIFDPFYTSKENGTGLGLSIAHTIVTAHSGLITVNSKPGKGTVFTVLLPRFPQDQENTAT